MILNIQGMRVEVENFDEFKKELLSKIAVFVEKEIEDQVERMNLVGQGSSGPNLSGSYIAREENGEIFITSTAPKVKSRFGQVSYAVFLEYGTFDYWDASGTDKFPDLGYPTIPKKKELTAEQREGMPKGMQPFAPIRRVVWNQKIMDRVIRNALRS